MGVPQPGGDLGFAMESGKRFTVGRQLSRHELDRHALVQTKMHGFVHRTHTTLTKKAGDAVGALKDRAN
jgi:hypothetical protein